MPVVLSMLAGAGAQFFDNNGNPLSGGLLYTYAAGTTTPQTTYTSSTGLTAHPNPIVLDAAGRVNQIWVDDALYYKFVLQTPFNVTIATYDNLYGPAAAERTIELDSGNNIALPNNLTVAGGLVVAGTTSLTGAVTAASPITLPASDPTLADQAARKAYVDAQDALRLALTGGTLSGPLLLNADPSAALGAATKQYVDAPVDELRGGISAVIATTSGTAHDVTGLPSWVNEIEVMLNGVSLSGTDDLLIRLGTSGGFVTTGYLSGSVSGSSVPTSIVGFVVTLANDAANAASGFVSFRRGSANIWFSSHALDLSPHRSAYGGGRVDAGGTVTQLRLLTTGSNTFDAGNMTVRWRR